jgi:ribosomal protein S12 methylthiotransferase accessory factor
MISRPRIKSKYHVETIPGDGIFLLSENERHVLEGESLMQLVPLLDGNHTWDELLGYLETSIGHNEILNAFSVLIDNNHIEEGAGALPPRFQAFWSELDCSAARAQRIVALTNIQILTLGDVDALLFDQSLHSFGFNYDAGKPASLVLVLTDDYQRPELEAINEHCLKHGIPWVLVKPAGLIPLIGPFIQAGKTACWKCLESRLIHNREVESYIQRKKGINHSFNLARMQVPLMQAQVVSIVTTQLVKWLVLGSNSTLESKIISLDVINAHQSFHTVVRRPQCPACGDPDKAHVGGRPVYIRSYDLSARDGNGMRAEPPEVTFQRYAHHVSEYSGAVKGIYPTAWNSIAPLKIYTAGHNFALKNDNLYFIKDGLRTSSSGKGNTDAQAKASALCEALERFSGLYRGEEKKIFASYQELSNEAVNPCSVTLYSEKQYKEREQWQARNSRFQVVPMPFDETAKISWSPVWSWTEQRQKYLPTSLLYYGFEDDPEKFFFWGDSNGNAAGSCKEDAMLQGFLELIERDCVALWWYNRLQRPQVDLESLKDPYIHELITFYTQHGRKFWVLDLTADLNIPVFAAINQRVNGPTEDIVMGFGAHLDARIGISRALTEMNQFMPAVLNTDEHGNTLYGYDDKDALEWWMSAKLDEQPYLKPQKGNDQQISDLAKNCEKDVKVQLEACFRRVENLGHEVLILDQTRPDVEIPVVKVIIPGLRHFWARYAPGRLYDIPVQLGWLKKPLTEDELNPIPMFI